MFVFFFFMPANASRQIYTPVNAYACMATKANVEVRLQMEKMLNAFISCIFLKPMCMSPSSL